MSNPTITDETALLIVSCAAAIHQQLYLVNDLLNEQARVLKGLISKRIRPTNDERTRRTQQQVTSRSLEHARAYNMVSRRPIVQNSDLKLDKRCNHSS
jgi:hypothetical protein